MDPKGKLKRKRSVNWSEKDKVLLKELIKSRVKDIENKNTDTNTNNTKKKAWLEVVESLDSMYSGGQRTLDQLKTQWAATKITARKQVAEHRKEILKTGGGSKPQEAPLSASDITVWLPNEFVVDTNEFDSDYVKEFFEETEKETQNEDETLTDEAVDVVEIPENNPKPDPILKKKENLKKQNTTDSTIKKIAEFDIECRKELHELQLQIEKKRMRNLDMVYEVEKKKSRNLDLESDLTIAKIKSYEQNRIGAYVFKYLWVKFF